MVQFGRTQLGNYTKQPTTRLSSEMAIYQQLTDPSIHRSHAAFSLGLLAKTGVSTF
jgi:hypothetical protein